MLKENRKKSFDLWGLSNNPFTTLPPSTEEVRSKVFTGRENEIEILTNMVKPPRGIFVSGMFGIGKSILALETLRVLECGGYKTAYIKYEPKKNLCLKLLRKLVRSLDGCSTHYNIYIQEVNNGTKSPEEALEEIIDDLNLRSSIVIVIDDLDKSNMLDIQGVIYDVRFLVDLGCSVILLGHPRGVTVSFSSKTDILYPLPLSPLLESELLEMMEKYLNLSRVRIPENETCTYPFTLNAAKMISKAITKFKLTPRLFNFSCQLLLESAACEGVKLIDEEFIKGHWDTIAEDFIIRSIRDEDREVLQIIYDKGGISEDTREVIQSIGGNFAEFGEVINKMVHLINKDILLPREVDGKLGYYADPLLYDKKIFLP